MRKKRQNSTLTCRRCRSSLAVLLAAAVAGAGIVPSHAAPCKEAKAAATLSNPRTDEDGVTTWDCVYFGSYWQNDTNGDGVADQRDEKEPIKWRVLSVDGDDAFLLADRCLDCKPYNTSSTDVTWETCTLRSWLNGYGSGSNVEGTDYHSDNFLDAAFSQGEQDAIKSTDVVNDDNSEYGTEGGPDTTDQIYLLSLDEVSNDAYGFHTEYGPNSSGRIAVNTAYARGQGAYTDFDYTSLGSGWWWLRSPGPGSKDAAVVEIGGYGHSYGYYVNNDNDAVRPALHLNLSSSNLYCDAGTVSFRGGSVRETVSSTARPSAPRTDEGGVTTWDCVWFGSYWQNDTNGDGVADQRDEKEPVKWRVLSVDGDDAFLLADRCLDCKPYNTSDTDVTWETCTLRSWLNGYGSGSNAEGTDYSSDNFMDAAFSQAEQTLIRSTEVANDNNPEYSTSGGNDTLDRVYLLSVGEASMPSYGFHSSFRMVSDTRIAINTAYVRGQRLCTNFSYTSLGSSGWWLRSPGKYGNTVADVIYDGDGSSDGANVATNIWCAVRPVLHLDLKVSDDAISFPLWSYAGTVSVAGGDLSDEEVATQPAVPSPSPTLPAGTPTATPTLPLPTASASPSPTPPSDTPTPSPTLPLSTESAPPQSTPPAGTPTATPAPSPLPTPADSGDLTDDEPGRDLTVTGLDLAAGNTVKKGFLTVPQVELSWDQNRRCDGYEIWRAEGSKDFRQIDTVDDADETEWYDTTVKKGTRYSYRVRGYVEDDNGDPVRGAEGRTVSVTIRKNIKSCTYTAKRTGRNLKITFKKAEGTKCVIQVRYRKSQAWKQASCKLNKKIVRKVSPKKLQVRIRTAEEIGGKLTYSKWSKVKTVR